jgi:hypothetical protein
MTEDEEFAFNWLKDRDYKAVFQPSLVTSGRCPDFLATASADATPNDLWVEVKSVEPEKRTLALSKAWPVLKGLAVPKGVNGYAMMEINERTIEQSIRSLLKMFNSNASKHSHERTKLVFIQQHPQQRDVRCVEVHQEDEAHRIWVRGAGTARIAAPPGLIKPQAPAVTRSADGDAKTQLAFEVFDWLAPYNCALVVRLDPNEQPLISIPSMAAGTSNVASRVINALQDANSQLRNAYRFKRASGMVLIIPEEYVDDLTIASAIYGKLTVPISTETNKLGGAFFGRDGTFRPNKNTHISVVVRLYRDGSPAAYFPNPFARQPIDEGDSLFGALRRFA